MKKGFSLVELSIVVVVVGLLIGGLLVGKSLIESAKINGVIRQVSEYQILVTNFRRKFKYFPGDVPNATTIFPGAANNGDGDGRIDYFAWLAAPVGNGNMEPFLVWNHLSLAKILNKQYTGVQGTSCQYAGYCLVPGTNAPTTALDNDTAFLFMSSDTNSFFSGLSNMQIMTISAPRPASYLGMAAGGTFSGPAFTPSQAMIFDSKIDDGMPYLGDVRGFTGSGYANNCSNGAYTSATKYDVTYTDKACSAMIKPSFGEFQ